MVCLFPLPQSEKKLKPSAKDVVVDVNIKSFNMDSDEHREFCPAYIRHAENQLSVGY